MTDKTEKKVLGRGISSLIRQRPQPLTSSPERNIPAVPEAGELREASGDLQYIPVDRLRVNPQNPRKHFDEVALKALSASISEAGLLQPLVVRRVDQAYEVIAGERRLRASQMAGLKEVPVLVRKSSDEDQLEVAIIENVQRRDLSPLEEAQGYERLATVFDLTQEQIAQKVGKDRSTVANLMRLLKLPSSVQALIHAGHLSMGHARALLGIEAPKAQEHLAQACLDEAWSVRELERRVAILQRASAEPTRTPAKDHAKSQDPNMRSLIEEIQRVVGTKVEWRSKKDGGEIILKYYSKDDLNRLLSVLRR